MLPCAYNSNAGGTWTVGSLVLTSQLPYPISRLQASEKKYPRNDGLISDHAHASTRVCTPKKAKQEEPRLSAGTPSCTAATVCYFHCVVWKAVEGVV